MDVVRDAVGRAFIQLSFPDVFSLFGGWLIVKLQIVVHVHLVDVVVDAHLPEAHLELVDGNVDVAVRVVRDVGNLGNDFRVFGLGALRAVFTHVAVSAPRVASADQPGAVIQLVDLGDGVCVAFDDAPCVFVGV